MRGSTQLFLMAIVPSLVIGLVVLVAYLQGQDGTGKLLAGYCVMWLIAVVWGLIEQRLRKSRRRERRNSRQS